MTYDEFEDAIIDSKTLEEVDKLCLQWLKDRAQNHELNMIVSLEILSVLYRMALK